jgi:uncharacterized protein DUF1553/uncharacterized protein DUF1549
VRIECAQCHDHPFGQWKRDEFWSYAAFFGGLEVPKEDGNGVMAMPREVQDRRELAIPNTDRVVQARYLDGNEPDWKPHVGARITLAEWITAADNPFFARAMVNRTWAQFFGTGLVDPVDDMGPHNLPSHPALLDEMAAQFAAHEFDVKFLMRAILLSRPYQLSSAMSDPSQADRRQFARIFPRGLTPDQLLTSLEQAGGSRPRFNNPNQDFNFRAGNLGDKFALNEDEASRFETSIIQALELMNGRLTNRLGPIGPAAAMQNFDPLPYSPLVTALVESPFMSSQERLETLFLATLTRLPTEAEVERLTKYMANPPGQGAGSTLLAAVTNAFGVGNSQREAEPLADVFWALLNSPEFLLNH